MMTLKLVFLSILFILAFGTVPAFAQNNLTSDPNPQEIDTGSCGENRATYGGVVRLRIRTAAQKIRMCSGVLISDKAVLTAAHCFADDNNQGLFNLNAVAINMHVQKQNSLLTPCITFSSNDNQCGERIFSVRLHPNWTGDGDTEDDIAVVTINQNKLRYQDKDIPIPNSDMARLYDDVWQRTRRQLRTGYGACRNDGFGSGTYRQKAIKVDDFFDLHYRDRAQINNRGCRGDSGGPAFTRGSSQLRPVVVGLHSNSVKWGRSNCAGVTLRQRWVKISPKVEWISQTLEALTGSGCRAPFSNADGFKYKLCFD